MQTVSFHLSKIFAIDLATSDTLSCHHLLIVFRHQATTMISKKWESFSNLYVITLAHWYFNQHLLQIRIIFMLPRKSFYVILDSMNRKKFISDNQIRMNSLEFRSFEVWSLYFSSLYLPITLLEKLKKVFYKIHDGNINSVLFSRKSISKGSGNNRDVIYQIWRILQEIYISYRAQFDLLCLCAAHL